MDETVLTALKPFPTLLHLAEVHFSLKNSGDGDLFTFVDNGDGTFDLTSGNTPT